MRILKKAFAAVAFGVIGYVAGGAGWGAYEGEKILSINDESCGPVLVKLAEDFNKIQNPTEEQINQLSSDMQAVPCYNELKDAMFRGMGISLGLGLVGVVGGATLVGRKKKEGPTPS